VAPRKRLFIRYTETYQQLHRFGEIEEVPNKTWTTEEILCEEHCKKHTTRNDTGRYVVRLLDVRVEAVWETH